jgi:hypothetical protein
VTDLFSGPQAEAARRRGRLQQEQPARDAWPGFSRQTALALWRGGGYNGPQALIGKTTREVAERTGLSDGTVANVLKRYGLWKHQCPYCQGCGWLIGGPLPEP